MKAVDKRLADVFRKAIYPNLPNYCAGVAWRIDGSCPVTGGLNLKSARRRLHSDDVFLGSARMTCREPIVCAMTGRGWPRGELTAGGRFAQAAAVEGPMALTPRPAAEFEHLTARGRVSLPCRHRRHAQVSHRATASERWATSAAPAPPEGADHGWREVRWTSCHQSPLTFSWSPRT